MFFEVKKSSFSSRFFSQIAPLSSLEKAVDPGVYHSHIFRQTNQNSFLVTLKNNLVIFDCLFRSICLTSSDMCHPHSFSQRNLSSKIPPNLSTVFLQQWRSLAQRHLSSKIPPNLSTVFLQQRRSLGQRHLSSKILPNLYQLILMLTLTHSVCPFLCIKAICFITVILPIRCRDLQSIIS